MKNSIIALTIVMSFSANAADADFWQDVIIDTNSKSIIELENQSAANVAKDNEQDVKIKNTDDRLAAVQDTLIDESIVRAASDAKIIAEIKSNEAEQTLTDSRQDNDITNLKGSVNEINQRLDEMDDHMDGIIASAHAINNARPFLMAEGQTAVGLGVGVAGNTEAYAFGAAHSLNTNWSVSATVNALKYDNSTDVSGGMGLQYVF